MGRRAFVAALLVCSVIVVAQIVDYALALGARDPAAGMVPYAVGAPRKADRVILVVVDSLALRTADDESTMPRLAALKRRGASGVLWASRQTGTEQGIVGLATGMRTGAFDFLGMFRGLSYHGWTVFDDLEARGEGVCFNGNAHWAFKFGDRGGHHHAAGGRAASAFTEDLEAIANAEAQLASASPPALTVIHIGETDLLAHQLGTLDPRYRAAIRRWDGILLDFIERAADDRTAVIITADHGNDVWGSHGGAADIYRRAPVVMAGAGIRPAHGFTMNITDMPATLAILLGTRLPGGAIAAPATAPIDLTAEEEATVLLATYGHFIALDAPDADHHRRKYGELQDLAARGQFDQVIAPARQSITDLCASLEPRRAWSGAGFFWTTLVFLGVAGLFAALRGIPLDRRGWAVALLVLGAAEALLSVRFWFAAPIKQLVAAAPAHAAAPCFALGVIAGMKGFLLVRWRARLLDIVARHSLWAIVLAYLACSALLPLSTLSLLSLALLAACARRAGLAAGITARIVLIFAVYFWVSKAILLPRLGESLLGVYTYGLCSAALAGAWLAFGPLRAVGRWPRVALLLLLILTPFGRLTLDMASAGFVQGAALVALGLLAALVVSRGGSRLSLIAIGLTGVALLAPSPATFVAALSGALLVFLVVAWSIRESRWLSLASEACAALCAMSRLEDVPSVVALFAVMVWASDLWAERASNEGALPAELTVGVWAVLVVCCRHAFFELFGRVASPEVPYALTHVDVTVGLLGGENLDMVRGTALVLLKMIVASWVALGAIAVAPGARGLGREIVLVAAALLLFDVAHAAVKASLSAGTLSDRFDGYVVTLTIQSAIFLSVVVGYALFRGLTAWRSWLARA